MNIVLCIFLLIIAFFLGMFFGYKYDSKITFKNNLSSFVSKVKTKLVTYWYGLTFLCTSYFVYNHFDECLKLKFTSDFNGTHLLFLFWLLLLVLPFFESFEGFGVSIKKIRSDKDFSQSRDDYEKELEKAANE